MASLTIRWEDRDWEYDPDMIDIRRGRMIEEFCGKPLYGWESGIVMCDVRCLAALLWEIKKQAGESTLPMKALNFAPIMFHRAVMDAQKAAIEEQIAELDDNPDLEDDMDPTGTPEGTPN